MSVPSWLKTGPLRIGLICTLSLLLVASCFTYATAEEKASKGTLTFTSLDYAPYTGKHLKEGGFVIAIVKAALEEVGYKVNVRFYPWSRSLEMAKKGKVDGILTIWHRKEREEWFTFCDPLPANEVGFFKLKSRDIKFTNLDALKQYSVGVCRDYAYPPAFLDAKFPKVKVAGNDVQNLQKLAAGRIDLILIEKGVANHLLDTKLKKLKDKVEWVSPAVESTDQHIAFSKLKPKHLEYRADFNRGLKLIRENGKLGKVLERFGFKKDSF